MWKKRWIHVRLSSLALNRADVNKVFIVAFADLKKSRVCPWRRTENDTNPVDSILGTFLLLATLLNNSFAKLHRQLCEPLLRVEAVVGSAQQQVLLKIFGPSTHAQLDATLQTHQFSSVSSCVRPREDPTDTDTPTPGKIYLSCVDR